MTVLQSVDIPYVVVPEDESTTGEQELEHFTIEVHDTRESVADATHDFNLTDLGPGEAVTQGNCGELEDGEPRAYIRVRQSMLSHTLILHELVHATQFAYNWSGMLNACEGNPWALDNEDYAYLLQISYDLALSAVDWSLSTYPHGVTAPMSAGLGDDDGR